MASPATQRADTTSSGASSAIDGLPGRDEFQKILGTNESRATPLLRILLARCKQDAPHAEQLVAVEQLGRFIVAGPPVPSAIGHAALARLELLVLALERIPAARNRFFGSLGAVFSNTHAIKFFGEVGLPNDRGLLAETTDRLSRRFLPEPPAPGEFVALAGRIVRRIEDIAWLGPAADPLLHKIAALGGTVWDPLRAQIHDAIGLISTRIAALGMGEAFRARGISATVRDSPLYHLTRSEPSEMPKHIAESRVHLDQVRNALEDRGVAMDLVYSLDAIERGLGRIELMLPFVAKDDDIEPTYEIRALLGAIGRGLIGGRSFAQLMSDNMRLLARKVIERAGRTGEHYVTSGRKEYFRMYGSAFGGGVLTLGTAAAKFVIKWGHWPLFVDGLLSSLDYAGSFVIMQLIGFTLATKQPSMTAASLAGTLKDGKMDELIKLITRIARSQFAAAMGNVTGVIITSLLFDQLWIALSGDSFLGAKDAVKTVKSFDPLGSGTILFAALTGVVLWISSIVAGWFENWVVYRRIPEAIEFHRFGKQIGKDRMARWARFIEHQAAGFGGSVSLGFLLGMIPVFGLFFGIPVEMRHITLSTGGLTLSMSSLGIDGAGLGPFIWACVGIIIIGIMNFGVSFALALVVALRARDVPRKEQRVLPGAVLRHFLRHPFQFFWPPKEAPGEVSTPTH